MRKKNKWHPLNTVKQWGPLNLTHCLRVFPLGCRGSWLMYGLYDNKLPFNVTDMSNLKYSQHTPALSAAKTHPENQSMSLALTSHVKVMSHFSSVAMHKRLTKSLSNICVTLIFFLPPSPPPPHANIPTYQMQHNCVSAKVCQKGTKMWNRSAAAFVYWLEEREWMKPNCG